MPIEDLPQIVSEANVKIANYVKLLSAKGFDNGGSYLELLRRRVHFRP